VSEGLANGVVFNPQAVIDYKLKQKVKL